MENSRKRTRIEQHFRGRLETDTASTPMITENLSLKGLLCNVAPDVAQLQPGQQVKVFLPLASDVNLCVDGVVVRHHDQQVAVDFEGMDEESYTHLRNIVRFSASDPDAIDKEQASKPFLPFEEDEKT